MRSHCESFYHQSPHQESKSNQGDFRVCMFCMGRGEQQQHRQVENRELCVMLGSFLVGRCLDVH